MKSMHIGICIVFVIAATAGIQWVLSCIGDCSIVPMHVDVDIDSTMAVAKVYTLEDYVKGLVGKRVTLTSVADCLDQLVQCAHHTSLRYDPSHHLRVDIKLMPARYCLNNDHIWTTAHEIVSRDWYHSEYLRYLPSLATCTLNAQDIVQILTTLPLNLIETTNIVIRDTHTVDVQFADEQLVVRCNHECWPHQQTFMECKQLCQELKDNRFFKRGILCDMRFKDQIIVQAIRGD